ncbi:hypothetical protein pb186bvf_016607 [Paramecium bursaria]
METENYNAKFTIVKNLLDLNVIYEKNIRRNFNLQQEQNVLLRQHRLLQQDVFIMQLIYPTILETGQVYYYQMINPFQNHFQYQYVNPYQLYYYQQNDQEAIEKNPKIENQIKEEYQQSQPQQKQQEDVVTNRYIQKKRTKRKYKKFYNQGVWTQKEHKLYLAFIKDNIDIILQPDLKRHYQVFKQISRMVRSRTAAQCRSHHQKFDFLSFLNKDSQDKGNSQIQQQ